MFFIIFISPVQAKSVEILFWHSMSGDLGTELNSIVEKFNRSQAHYHIKAVYRGDYLEALTSFAASFRAKQSPAIVQVFEVAKETMLQPKGIIKPVEEMMQEQGMQLPMDSFLPVVRNYYSQNGSLVAMPFNISLPVLFYNQDALAKIGYSKENFPKTWTEFQELEVKLQRAGYSCAYTSAYPAWVFIESYSALHKLPLIDTEKLHALYNNPAIIREFERLLAWQKAGYFQYGGRTNDATYLFSSGRCAMFSQSSGSYGSLSALSAFRVGVASLPVDDKLSSKRYSNVAGGGALWVVSGKPQEVYRGVAAFFVFLAKPEIQFQWQKNTGYIPLGLDGFYQKTFKNSQNLILQLARQELGADNSALVQEGMQNQIRQINDTEIEAMFAGIKSPKQALDDAVLRANYALLRFKKNTGVTND